MEEDKLQRLCLMRLQEAISVASLAADQQIAHFPPELDVSYEIASEFSHWCRWALEHATVELTKETRFYLEQLDTQFDRMSGSQNSRLWTDRALRETPEWEMVRKRAAYLLKLFDWQNDGDEDGDLAASGL